jgi:hypothetical protein
MVNHAQSNSTDLGVGGSNPSGRASNVRKIHHLEDQTRSGPPAKSAKSQPKSANTLYRCVLCGQHPGVVLIDPAVRAVLVAWCQLWVPDPDDPICVGCKNFYREHVRNHTTEVEDRGSL